MIGSLEIERERLSIEKKKLTDAHDEDETKLSALSADKETLLVCIEELKNSSNSDEFSTSIVNVEKQEIDSNRVRIKQLEETLDHFKL